MRFINELKVTAHSRSGDIRKTAVACLTVIGVGLLVFAFSASTWADDTKLNRFQEQLTSAYRLAVPAMVRIQVANDGKPRVTQGVIISRDGLVVVHDGADRTQWKQPITVTLSSGRQMNAKSLGWTEEWRIGLLQIETQEALPSVELANSTNRPVGEMCFALDFSDSYGPGFDEQPTMRLGFVQRGGSGWFISSCEFGNLGGFGAATFNSRGQLIGLTTRRKAAGWEIQTDAGVIRQNLHQLKQEASLDIQLLKASTRPQLLPTVGMNDLETARAASVRIRPSDNPSSNFSGTTVTAEGLIMSCAHHGIGSGGRVSVEFPDGKVAQGRILGTNPVSDVCLIQLNDAGPWPFALVGNSFSQLPNSPVTIYGYPHSSTSLTPDELTRRVIRVDGFSDSYHLLAERRQIYGGMSGGGAFDENGRLIGIHSVSVPLAEFEVRVETFFHQWDTLSQEWTDTAPKSGEWEELKLSAQHLVAQVAPGVVELFSGETRVAHGIVVSSKGTVLTKASELIEPITCRLSNGVTLPAAILKVSPEHDLALLSVEAADLKSIRISMFDRSSPSCLAVAVMSKERLEPGVIAHSTQAIASHDGIILPLPGNAVEDGPEGLKVTDDQWLQTLNVPLKKGDEILSFCRSFVGTKNEWEKLDKSTYLQVKGTAGDPVQLRVRRNGEVFTFRMPLFPPVLRLPNTSARSSGFPAAFDMALKLSPDDCGAPVVGIDGSCIGLVAARRTRGRVYIIPSTVMVEFCEIEHQR